LVVTLQLPGFSLHHSKIILSIASSNLGGVVLYQPYEFKRKVHGGGESQFTPMKIACRVEASLVMMNTIHKYSSSTV
jgi:hypothetical protein